MGLISLNKHYDFNNMNEASPFLECIANTSEVEGGNREENSPFHFVC
jgi:hypothetical protein